MSISLANFFPLVWSSAVCSLSSGENRRNKSLVCVLAGGWETHAKGWGELEEDEGNERTGKIWQIHIKTRHCKCLDVAHWDGWDVPPCWFADVLSPYILHRFQGLLVPSISEKYRSLLQEHSAYRECHTGWALLAWAMDSRVLKQK